MSLEHVRWVLSSYACFFVVPLLLLAGERALAWKSRRFRDRDRDTNKNKGGSEAKPRGLQVPPLRRGPSPSRAPFKWQL